MKSFKNMDFIEKLFIISNDVHYVGFYGSTFLIYNLTKKIEIFSIACGGNKSIFIQ
jgi:hypothetical protein